MSDWSFDLSLTDVLLFPVTLPAKGFLLILEQLREQVDGELYDEAALRKKLLDLELEFELGNVGEEAYRRQRAVLVGRLGWLQELKRAGEEE